MTNTPRSTFRIYLSSTWVDLRAEREAVERTIHRMRETKFVGMEYFGARDESTADTSIGELEAADVYIGLFGRRYGSGITEREYRRARMLGLPCLVYLLDDLSNWHDPIESDADTHRRLAALKAELTRHTVVRFTTADDLAVKVATDLHNLLFERFVALGGESQAGAQSRALERYFSGELDRSLRDYLRAVRSFIDSSYRSLPFPDDRSPADVYVPLRARASISAPSRSIAEVLAAQSTSNDAGPVLIVGAPGAGKSTLLRQLARHAWHEPDAVGLGRRHLPILVRLQCLARVPGASLEERLWNSVAEAKDILMESGAPRGWYDGWSRATSAPWLLLLDGFDEVPDPRRAEVMGWVRELCRRGARIVLTSRPATELMPSEPFGRLFTGYTLEPLSDGEQEALARRWLGTRADAFLRESRRLRTSIIAGTPLLITIALIVFDRDGRLPTRRAALYRRFVEVWWREALARGVEEELGADLTDLGVEALQELAWAMASDPDMRSRQVLEATLLAFLTARRDALSYLTSRRSERLLDVLGRRSGIFQCTATECEWLHRTFLEYLAAERASSLSPDSLEAFEICHRWYQNQWQEVILFLLGIWSERGADLTELLTGLREAADRGDTRAAATDPQPWMNELPAMCAVFAARALAEGVVLSNEFRERLLDELFAEARKHASDNIGGRALSHVVIEHRVEALASLSEDIAVVLRVEDLARHLLVVVRQWPPERTSPAAIDDLAVLGYVAALLELASDATLGVSIRFRVCDVLMGRGRRTEALAVLRGLLYEPIESSLLRRGVKLLADAGEAEYLEALSRGQNAPAAVRMCVPEALLQSGHVNRVHALAADGSLATEVQLVAKVLEAINSGMMAMILDEVFAACAIGVDAAALGLAAEYLARARAWTQLQQAARNQPLTPFNDAAVDTLIANRRTEDLVAILHDTTAPAHVRRKAAEAVHVPGQADEAATLLLALVDEQLRDNPSDTSLRQRRSELLLDVGRCDEAIDECTDILAAIPDDLAAREWRALSYLAANRGWEAAEDFGIVLPRLTTAVQRWFCLTHRGIAYAITNLPERALEDFDAAAQMEEAPDLSAHNTRFRSWLAWSLYATGRYEEAASVSAESPDIDTSARLLAVRGAAYSALGRDGEALASLDRAIELDPNHAWTVLRRADCHRTAGRLSDAAADLARVLELAPEDIVARARLLELRLRTAPDSVFFEGLSKLLSGSPPDVGRRHCLEQACALANDSSAPAAAIDAARTTLRGWLLEQADDRELARAEYRRAITLRPQWAPPHALLGLSMSTLFFTDGSADDAERELSEAVQCAPDDEVVRAALVRHLVETVAKGHEYEDEYAAGIDACTRALKVIPDDRGAREQRATLYWYDERYEEALADVAALLTQSPDNLRLLSTWGQILADAGRAVEAIAELEEVVARMDGDEMQSDRGYARGALGLAYATVGERERAVEILNASLVDNRYNAWAYYNRAGVHALLGHAADAAADFKAALEAVSPKLSRAKRERVERALRDTPSVGSVSPDGLASTPLDGP